MKKLIVAVGFVFLVIVAFLVCQETSFKSLSQRNVVITETAKVETPTTTPTKGPTETPTTTSTVTSTSSPTATVTATSTATPVTMADPSPGYTFYGTQLEFLVKNFGWTYEISSCASGYLGVGNVLTGDSDSCAIRLYAPAKDRSVGLYLISANRYVFPEGSNRAKPYDYWLYVYTGSVLSNGTEWQYYKASELWDKLRELGFYEESNSTDLRCSGPERPTVQKFIPLSQDEFDTVQEHPELFPVWGNFCE